MFSHTHVYFSKKLSEKITSYIVIGSILPDSALSGNRNWVEMKVVIDLAGMIIHEGISCNQTGLSFHHQ